MPPYLLAGLGAGIGSGILGAITSGDSQNKALQQELQAANQYLSVLVPDPKDQQLLLQQYQQTGKMDPRLQQAMQQAKTQMSSIQTDPGLKSAQLSALQSLQDVSNRGGRTLQQDAYMNKLQNDVGASNRGRIGAIQSNFAQRGMGQPGGLELQAQLSNAQNETQRENSGSMNAAAQAQQNALQAIQQAGGQAGQMRNQDFNQQAQVAQAQDQINRFNTAALNTSNAANVNAQNAAQAYNLQNSQNIANRNTDTANQQQIHNQGLYQQQFQNQMSKAAGQANALNNVATQYNNTGNTNAGMWSGIGQGLATAGVAGQMWSDKNKGQNDSEEES